MGKLDKAKIDAFARGVAAGLSIRAAATAAGHHPASNACYEMARKETFKAEVRRLELEHRHGGSNDLAPIIAILMEGAIGALAKGDAPFMMAAARMLAEAARLKQKLPSAYDAAEEEAWAKLGHAD